MNKDDLVNLLNELDIPVNEGIQNDRYTNIYPRIVFWDYVWDPIIASNKEYDTKVTYQISFFSKEPRNPKLLKLRKKLAKKEIFPYIEREYIKKDQYFHSFFAIDVLENLDIEESAEENE